MQHIPIEAAEPEMVLAKEIQRPDNPSGPPICGKGVVLNTALIVRLKNMGITQVCVEGHPVWQEGDKTLDELLSDLDRRFSKVRGNPRMEKLKAIFEKRINASMGLSDER